MAFNWQPVIEGVVNLASYIIPAVTSKEKKTPKGMEVQKASNDLSATHTLVNGAWRPNQVFWVDSYHQALSTKNKASRFSGSALTPEEKATLDDYNSKPKSQWLYDSISGQYISSKGSNPITASANKVTQTINSALPGTTSTKSIFIVLSIILVVPIILIIRKRRKNAK